MRPASLPRFLAACTLSVALLLGAAAAELRAHDDDLAGGSRSGTLDGTWRLVSPPLAGGAEEYKLIGDGRFHWYVVADDRIVRGAGGRADFRDGRYVERIEHVQSPDDAWMVGARGTFQAIRDGDTWRHRGHVIGNGLVVQVDETWERVR